MKARHVKIAKLAVRDAERAEKERRETKQKHGTYAEKEQRAKASLARARGRTTRERGDADVDGRHARDLDERTKSAESDKIDSV